MDHDRTPRCFNPCRKSHGNSLIAPFQPFSSKLKTFRTCPYSGLGTSGDSDRNLFDFSRRFRSHARRKCFSDFSVVVRENRFSFYTKLCGFFSASSFSSPFRTVRKTASPRRRRRIGFNWFNDTRAPPSLETMVCLTANTRTHRRRRK